MMEMFCKMMGGRKREILEYLREGRVGEGGGGRKGLLIGHRITTHGQKSYRFQSASWQAFLKVARRNSAGAA